MTAIDPRLVARYERKLARIAFWDRPLRGRGDRLRAWANMLVVDHGVVRLAYRNRHQVSPEFWRSAQPAPHDIAAAARLGIRTVVNLRGPGGHGSWPLERDACEAHGLKLADFLIRSRGAPEREMVLAAPAFFEQLEYPVLVHCKSGADRAGFMAALYVLLRQKRTLEEAMDQLHWRFGHVRLAKTGILDAFFERYREDGLARGTSFLDWVARDYDPEALEREFRPGRLSSLVVDTLLRRE
jgi:protein tyrosine/serine phosphatase